MAVATEVDENDLFLAFLAAALGLFEGGGQGVAVAAPAGDDVVTALRDIYASLEGLRQELRERG